MSIVSVVQVVLVPRVPPLPCSPPIVSVYSSLLLQSCANNVADSKQARDLVAVLTESKQQIDPKLHEMARFGGGGGGRGWGGGRGRGGGGRGRGGGFHSGGNSDPIRNSRW